MTYGRAWHAARQTALGPGLAATALARRPYDLWHAALSLWLNASGTPAEVAARAGNSARVLHEVYLHCTDGQDDAVSQRIEDALDAGAGITHASPHTKASGYTNRRHHPRPCPLTCIAAVTASGFRDGPFTVLGRASVCSLALIAAGSCERAAGSGGAKRPRSGAAGALDAAARERIMAGGGKGANAGVGGFGGGWRGPFLPGTGVTCSVAGRGRRGAARLT